MQKAYKNLMANSFIFALANLGSKIITFIMVPIYTYVLDPGSYGTIDIVTTISSFSIPIVFMCIPDAVMRYTMGRKHKREDILTNGLSIYFQGLCIAFFAVILLAKFLNIDRFKWFFLAILATNGLLMIFNQFLRSVDKVIHYAINGVLYTLVFVCLNILFLLWLKLGVEGYFYSMLIANAICVLYAFLMAKAWKYITRKPSKVVLKTMLRYSIPLIPNSIMWWIMDASDKFVIAYFLGVSANGVYAIAKKIPTVIDTFHGIFNQAWQISAIQEVDSEDVVGFTSNTYKLYTILLFGVVSILMMVARPTVKYLFSSEYSESWKYIPLLLIAVVFSCLSGFLSANFIANENTRIIFRTTVYGAVINTVLNFMFVPLIGINGAALATALSFFVVMMIRERKIIKQGSLLILFNRKILFAIVASEIIVYYLFSIWVSFIIIALLTLCLLFGYRDVIFLLIKKGIHNVKRRDKDGGNNYV